MDTGVLLSLITVGVLVLFVLGVPIFLVIGFWVVGASIAIDFTLANVGVTLFEGLNFFGLLALPLFILTGDLIAAAGIARRLADFAHACVSWMRGGLGLATIGSCGLFAAISGSNAATTATIGSNRCGGGYRRNYHSTVNYIYRLRVHHEPVDFRSVCRGDYARHFDAYCHDGRVLVAQQDTQHGHGQSVCHDERVAYCP